eukprot:m51a1_g1278 hypothetical protein (634) ;mRNA; f:113278-115179
MAEPEDAGASPGPEDYGPLPVDDASLDRLCADIALICATPARPRLQPALSRAVHSARALVDWAEHGKVLRRAERRAEARARGQAKRGPTLIGSGLQAERDKHTARMTAGREWKPGMALPPPPLGEIADDGAEYDGEDSREAPTEDDARRCGPELLSLPAPGAQATRPGPEDAQRSPQDAAAIDAETDGAAGAAARACAAEPACAAAAKEPEAACPEARQRAPSRSPDTAGGQCDTKLPTVTCYVCRQGTHEAHPFYPRMCHACGERNLEQRNRTFDLRGRVALVTGSRVKVGYQVALKLLRAGCTVVATTRFPRDAARRFMAEPDAAAWKDRLSVEPLDLRQLLAIETTCARLRQRLGRLDMVINNAAQTIRRPPALYVPLVKAEATPLPPEWERIVTIAPGGCTAALPAATAAPQATLTDVPAAMSVPGAEEVERAVANGAAVCMSAKMALAPLIPGDCDSLPEAGLTEYGDPRDPRRKHSWNMRIGDIPIIEALETTVVNSLSPLALVQGMLPLLRETAEREKVPTFVINVSAMEGAFHRRVKTPNHVHTNMAKASLNMMVRTCAKDLSRQGVLLNAVDTGWIDDMSGKDVFIPPIDCVDGAARVLEPVWLGLEGKPIWGQFRKDYISYPW